MGERLRGWVSGGLRFGELSRALSHMARRHRRFVTVAVAVVFGVALVVVPAAVPAHAACGNPVACENQLPGTPQSVWDISNGDGATIQGFADPFSVNVGGTINFKIKSPASSYKISIYRIGYYGGDGARLITTLTPNISVSQSQPACNVNNATGLIDCGNWGVSASWAVPTDTVSGVFFARLDRTDGTQDDNQIPFVVTNNASTSDIVFMTNDTTWQAYNDWGQGTTPTSINPGGGNSLYFGTATDTANSHINAGRAVAVSYNRPFATRFDTTYGQDFFFSMEYPMVRFLEENGYNVSYVSSANVDADTSGQMLSQHKVFLTAGHSEYWSAGMRSAVTAARNAGTSLAFFAGNLMWWKVRWASSQYGNEPYRTMITYKESIDSAQTDPADPPTWTGEWRDPRFAATGDDSGQPENALTGQLWFVNCCSYAEQVPSAYSKLRFWRNTSVAQLQPGQTATLSAETLGYEWDEDVDNGFRPPGEIDMSSTTENVDQLLLDYSEDIGTGQATNHLTLYRAASGALVFDAGTVQWSWGLDSDHDTDNPVPVSPAMQQATINLLADMGAQPATLMAGMVAATQSTDHTPPTTTITSPTAGASINNGSSLTVSGSSTDSGGGVVAGVEVSLDGGATWHPVTTMSAPATMVTWSYTAGATGAGSVNIEARATDDSGNIETPKSVTVTVNCPCSMFGQNYTPATTSESDTGSYELGVKFQTSVNGWVAGVRFYKGSGNTGTHTGSLWTASGTRLATGTFTNETASGWQTLLFTNAVEISANTTYVVSYTDPTGHYSVDAGLFDFPYTAPPFTSPRSGTYIGTGTTNGNGVYNAGGPGFPTSTYNASSYAVDVIFDTQQPKGPPPSIVSATPAAGSSSNPTSTHPSVTFSEPVTQSSVTFTVKDSSGNTIPGTVSWDSTSSVVTFTPSAALSNNATYTISVSGATDQFGQTMTSYTATFITSKAYPPSGSTCPCTIWPDVAPTGVTDATDSSSVELGVTFTPAADGTITGVRFYKTPDNTGTHTGTLWNANGSQLATGTFTSESTQGWQELDFSSPVTVTAGTTYVASYHTSGGHYAATMNGLANAVTGTNSMLTAAANGGVYTYGSSTAFPTHTFNSSNYWVDVVFQPDTSPLTVTGTTPGNQATNVRVGTSVTVTFNKPIKSGSPTFSVTDPKGNAVAGSTSLDSTGKILTFTPSSPLTASTAYTASVSGAVSTGGIAMTGSDTWSFTTSGVADCPCTIFESDATPATPDVNDSESLELGVQFQADTNGWITGIRFYKGTGNTGTHTGTLWSSTGTQLATGTFTNETTSGWQTLTFSTPVAVTAGTTYVASYFAPNGNYAGDGGFFSQQYDNSPLHALSGQNGLYIYGSSPQFPTHSYNSANYYVDVMFTTQAP